MKKILSEAKADIDSGIAKSMSSAKLDYRELKSLEETSFSDLISDHGLDTVMAEIVINHVRIERQRLEYQNQYISDDEFESIGGGYGKSYPFRESLKRRIRKIISEVKSNLN